MANKTELPINISDDYMWQTLVQTLDRKLDDFRKSFEKQLDLREYDFNRGYVAALTHIKSEIINNAKIEMKEDDEDN